MSKAAASRKGKKAKKEKANESGSAGLWWGGMVCGIVLVLAPGSAILVGALLLPVVGLALFTGRNGGRAVQASLLFGLAGCVHPLHVLWGGEVSPAAAIALLRQPMVLATGWIALLAGWLVSELAAAGLRVQADIVAASQRRRMMARIAEIEDEWGPLPAAAPLPPL
ncbi:hypothetical protein NFI95_10405 [Acetobacteraceae bacterium KSS8]|uniref:Uncharacterized protein n=1 Tax=Endosaccharibacter trunci TaxID=2812733 RepID=A0ABT1W7K5_9PROT|nr:hypothetical protein [Acetobacteraceae bacterium KSS8]